VQFVSLVVGYPEQIASLPERPTHDVSMGYGAYPMQIVS
jgi:hypothetical protein